MELLISLIACSRLGSQFLLSFNGPSFVAVSFLLSCLQSCTSSFCICGSFLLCLNTCSQFEATGALLCLQWSIYPFQAWYNTLCRSLVCHTVRMAWKRLDAMSSFKACQRRSACTVMSCSWMCFYRGSQLGA